MSTTPIPMLASKLPVDSSFASFFIFAFSVIFVAVLILLVTGELNDSQQERDHGHE